MLEKETLFEYIDTILWMIRFVGKRMAQLHNTRSKDYYLKTFCDSLYLASVHFDKLLYGEVAYTQDFCGNLRKTQNKI